MKKFNSIREFIDYAPKCMFCESPMNIIIETSDRIRVNKKGFSTLNPGVNALALYRGVVEKSAINAGYNYKSRIENNKFIIKCTERVYLKNQETSYDVMFIDIDTSDVVLSSEVEVGILNSFARLNFKLLGVCTCAGHTYASTKIIAGAKSKKIMPFFLRDEWMSSVSNDITYTLKSDYYSVNSLLEKSSISYDYNNAFVGLSADAPATTLPLVDLSVIKSRDAFEYKVENYVTFS